MADLAILVPSRGRPENVARLIEACEKTCRTDVLLMWGFDEDDPCLSANLAAAKASNSCPIVQPRMGLAAWTNYLCAGETAAPLGYPHLASLGDDMVPITDGWDEKLIEACGPCGMAYPWDLRRNDIPEAIVMDSRIVRALGWMALPDLHHWFIDNVWADLGNLARCLTYVPEVTVEHRHPNITPGLGTDATYDDAVPGFAKDMAAYQKWRLKGMRADVEKIRDARAAGS